LFLVEAERIEEKEDLKENQKNRQEIPEERGQPGLAVRDAGRVHEKHPHEDIG
jgi:hypothetical protein